MSSIRIVIGLDKARSTLFSRQPIEATRLSEEVNERLKTIFGELISPEQAVERIITEVRARGDIALREYTARIDGVQLDKLSVPIEEIDAAYNSTDTQVIEALSTAAQRIWAYHERQLRRSWFDFEAGLGQIVRPLDRVGIYAPGGRASYPSTVLMTAIPARVAGVAEIIVTSPAQRDGKVAPIILAAAKIAQVNRVYRVGGAQAIAAMALGTESMPKVNKICGPGNIFVTLAKKLLYGQVGIDGLYGPTEMVLVADSSANPVWCAADLLAQAEHDALASPLMITDSLDLAEQVREQLVARLEKLERRAIAVEALAQQGGIAVVANIEEAIELANGYAPEHLCLAVTDPWPYVGSVRNAGGLFIGHWSAEALGDYTAGPSHVMPTGGTARFSSPLSVDDFLKTTSVIALGADTVTSLAKATMAIAKAEGLTAHAEAVEVRLQRDK